MGRFVLRGVSAGLSILLAGCSLFGPWTQTITVSSDPSGATVLVNGSPAGHTPLRYQVPRREDLLLEVRLPGYQTEYRTSSRSLSTLGTLDLIGGAFILLPFFGLLSPAAWEQEPSTFGVVLTPSGGSKSAE